MANEKMVQNIIDYLANVADETVIAALYERGMVVTRQATESVLPEDITCIGSVQLTRIDGVPISRAKVTVSPVVSTYSITSADGTTYHPNLSVIPVSRYTDGEGRAEFTLIKGAPISIYTSLSSATREITVPDHDFNLLAEGVEVAADMYSNPNAPRKVILRSDL